MGKVKPRGLTLQVSSHNYHVMLTLDFQAMLGSLPFIPRCYRAHRKEGPSEPSSAEPTLERGQRELKTSLMCSCPETTFWEFIPNCHAYYKWALLCLINMVWEEDKAASHMGATSVTAPSARQPSLDHQHVVPSPGAVHRFTEKAEGTGKLAGQQFLW